MSKYAPTTKDVEQAVRIIKEGRVVAFPTGTAYGLAVDALQGHALQRLRNLKQRPDEKTFTVFAREDLWDTYFWMTSEERDLLARHKLAALTLLLRPKEHLQHLGKNGRVGLRVIDHPVMKSFAGAVDAPLTATSANVSGRDPCYDTLCIRKQFPGKVDPTTPGYERAGDTTYDLSLGCILDGGKLEPGRISTVAKVTDGKIEVVREGALKL